MEHERPSGRVNPGVHSVVCCDHFNLVVWAVRGLRLQRLLNRNPSVLLGSESYYTLFPRVQESGFRAHEQPLPSKIKMALLWKAFSAFPHHHTNPPASRLPQPPSRCNLSCQLPRFVFGSDPSPSVRQSHSMFTSPKGPSLPAHNPLLSFVSQMDTN